MWSRTIKVYPPYGRTQKSVGSLYFSLNYEYYNIITNLLLVRKVNFYNKFKLPEKLFVTVYKVKIK